MNKKISFTMAAIFMMVLCGCSNKDEMGDINEGRSPTENSEKENENSSNGTNDDLVDFQLQDEYGIECYNFNEGDNIIFRLEIKNDADEDAIVRPFSEIIGFDAFRVYSIDGENKGTPWDQILGNYRGRDIIPAHGSVIFLCPWFDIPALYCNGHEHYYSNMYYKIEEKLPLPKGEYYSKFDIKLNGKTINCYRSFKIK